MKPIITSYTVNDAQDILAIINYNIVNTVSIYDYQPRSLQQQIASFDEIIFKGFPVIVAKIGSKAIGFGYYNSFRYRDAYQFTVEHSVYVHQDFQGKKIGYLLLNELMTLAKAQNIHTMIGVIDSKNQSSIDFHKKMGFEVVGTIKQCGFKFNQWLDTVFMQKIL